MEPHVTAQSHRPGDRVFRRGRRRPERIAIAAPRLPRRPLPPANALVASFLIATALGALLLMLPISSAGGYWTSPIVALFTSTSAVTVTGLAIVDTGTYWSPVGQAIILALIQLGGLGFMTGASLVFLLLGRRLSLHERLLLREAVGSFSIGDVARLARRVASMAFAIEAVGAIVLLVQFLRLYPPGTALWNAVFLSVSAFNNAGFDVLGGFRSVTVFHSDPSVLLTLALLIILGGLSYLVLVDVVRQRSFTRLSLDTKIVLTTSIALWGSGFVAILGAEWNNPATLGPMPVADKALNAFFTSVTTRSAGFNSINLGGLAEETLFLVIGLMFIGGASASTAGGIRLNTFSVLLSAIVATTQGRGEVVVFRRTIPQELVNRALAIALLSVAFVFTIAYLLASTETVPFLQLLFETISAFGSVGLSTGITPRISPIGAALAMLTMFIGRLGPLTLAVVLAGRLTAPHIRYAQELVRVG